MRSHWIWVVPKSNDLVSFVSEDTQRKRLLDNGVRDWGDLAAVSQGMLRIASNYQMLGEAWGGFSLAPAGANPADTLILDF